VQEGQGVPLCLAGMAFISFNDKVSPNLKFDVEDGSLEELKKEQPLRYPWTIWEQIMQDAKPGQYSDATHKVSTFSTVLDFWRHWEHLPQPSVLMESKRMVRTHADGEQVIDALMIFRDGVRPEWEDEKNATGGHFQYQLKPNLGAGQIDEYWNNLLLGMVGATIEPANMLMGVRLVDKLSGPRAANAIRLEVWFTNYEDAPAVNLLRRNVERCMATHLDGSQGHAPRGETKSHSSGK